MIPLSVPLLSYNVFTDNKVVINKNDVVNCAPKVVPNSRLSSKHVSRHCSDVFDHIPDKLELPQLDFDQSDGSDDAFSRRSSLSTFKNYRDTLSIAFVECTNDHPLCNNSEAGNTSNSSKTNKIRNGNKFMPSLLKRERSANNRMTQTPNSSKIPEKVSTNTCDSNENDTDIEISGPCQELCLFSEKKTPLINTSPRKFYRGNADFLRVLVAKRKMYENGKLNYVQCSPFLSSRKDVVPKTCIVEPFGIPIGWSKPARRNWQQLNVVDFAE